MLCIVARCRRPLSGHLNLPFAPPSPPPPPPCRSHCDADSYTQLGVDRCTQTACRLDLYLILCMIRSMQLCLWSSPLWACRSDALQICLVLCLNSAPSFGPVSALHPVPFKHTEEYWLMQGSEYTTDGRDSHPSPGGTSRSDVSPQQLTAGGYGCGFVGSNHCSHHSCVHLACTSVGCLTSRLHSSNATLPYLCMRSLPLALSHGCASELQPFWHDQSCSPLQLSPP